MDSKVMNISGKADVMVKAADNYKINGKSYIKGQLITTIQDASFNIDYAALNKNITGKTLYLAFSDFEPRTLNIMARNLNESLADILFNEKTENENHNVPESENQTSDGAGMIILNNIPANEPIFVFNQNREVVTGYSANADGIISGLTPDTEYYITYYITVQFDTLYKLGKNQLPYFTVEIKNEVNFDNAGQKMFIQIPKAALEITPTLGFNSGEIVSVPLTFNIIEAQIYLGFY